MPTRYARLFSADGQALGSEFVVNAFTAQNQGNPAVAMGATGNFVVAWNGRGSGAFREPRLPLVRQFSVQLSSLA